MRTRLRRKSKKQVRTTMLDRLAREVVFKRDGKCVRCGSREHLQWCHVYSRRYHSVRWDLDNSFVGCAGCHLFWHHQPLEAARWFATAYPERANRLRLRMQTPSKPDKEAIRLALEAELK